MKPQKHYDPNTGKWDGQLPFPEPDIDGTFSTLAKWANRLPISAGAHRMLMTMICHMDWRTGAGCFASVETLAGECYMSERAAKRRIKELVDAGVIVRRRQLIGSTLTSLRQTVSEEPKMARTYGHPVGPITREEDIYIETDIDYSSSLVRVSEMARTEGPQESPPAEPDPECVRSAFRAHPEVLDRWRNGKDFAVDWYCRNWDRFLVDLAGWQQARDKPKAKREKVLSRQRR